MHYLYIVHVHVLITKTNAIMQSILSVIFRVQSEGGSGMVIMRENDEAIGSPSLTAT